MEGRTMRGSLMELVHNDHWRSFEGKALLAVAGLYLATTLATAFLGKSWTGFRALYSAWYLTFLLLLYLLVRSPLPAFLGTLRWWQGGLLLLLLAFLFHLPFLFQEPFLSQDIMRLERRGILLMDGQFPYRDFDVNKPPLYIWMVWLISFPLGPDQRIFRLIFSLANAFIPPLMLLLGRYRTTDAGHGNAPGGMSWSAGALAYLLCPVAIIEVGLAGHFDPVVVVMTLMGMLALLKKKYLLSGIMLGTGFALKIYPLFLLPFFFLSIKGWKGRLMMASGFLVVPFLSALPILLVDPTLLLDYARYQTMDWYTGFSIRFVLEWLLGMIGLSPKLAFYVMTLGLIAGSGYFYYRGLFGPLGRRQFMVLALLLVFLASLQISFSLGILYLGSGPVPVFLGAFAMLFSMLMLGMGPALLVRWRVPVIVAHPPEGLSAFLLRSIAPDALPLLATAGLLVLLLASSQFHPWYLLWLLPFALRSPGPWSWFLLTIFPVLEMNSFPPWEMGGF